METIQSDGDLQQIFQRILRKLVVYGKYVDPRFSGSQVAALDVIHAQGPIKVTHLAESLTLSLSAVTLLCDRLIHNGYVKRERDDEDRRVVHLRITDEGREALAAVLAAEGEIICRWLNGISKADLIQFNKTFQQIVDNVDLDRQVKKKTDDSVCCQ
ncbi:MarR family winged helix-turn-helix transcriptional regulator [Paenibacillus piri]|nr:MarR family transcriptional regulator [Paenibacillus piri]